MRRSINELQEDIKTLTRICSFAIQAKLDEIAKEVGEVYQQGRIDALKEIQTKMYEQCFEKDNPENMQKWDGGNWLRYKLFENVIEQIKEQNNEK